MRTQLTQHKTTDELNLMSEGFTQNRIMADALDLAGVMILAITDTRQIVYANTHMLRYFQRRTVDQIVGMRPGEAMDCVHSKDSPGGCGAGVACAHCSALDLIIKGISTDVPVEDEVLIHRDAYGINSAINLKVKVVPYGTGKMRCFILTLQDNTDVQRRRELERIYFHDILNATGAIKNYLALLMEEAPESMKADVAFLNTALADTIEDIHSQKSLGDAESQDYQVHVAPLSPDELCHSVMSHFRFHKEKDADRLEAAGEARSPMIFTDGRILRRILINMVKNALEATAKHEQVKLRYESYENQDYSGRFMVWNPGFIEPAVQLRIFNRSFSTKGYGRGLGTYSMKLLGEKYLGAAVGFSSTMEKGTEFYILMPANREEKA